MKVISASNQNGYPYSDAKLNKYQNTVLILFLTEV